MLKESLLHTDEVNELPWRVNPENDAEILDAKGEQIATFEVRHVMHGVLANCGKNADLAVRAVNYYTRMRALGKVDE